MHLLAVDDETQILRIIRASLEDSGKNRIDCAESAAEALEMIRTSDDIYDCILLDIQMPDMDGIELCREVRRHENYKSSPILMLTAMSQMHHVEEAFKAGANDYVTKPFNFRQLRHRIARSRNIGWKREHAAEGFMAEDSDDQRYWLDSQSVRPAEGDETNSRLLSSWEFDNFLRQLPFSTANQSSLFGFKIANLPQLERRLESDDLHRLIDTVAEHVATETSRSNGFVTYRGRGTFLCLETNTGRQRLPDLSKNLNLRVSDLNLEMAPVIVFGDRARSWLRSRAEAHDLLQKAVSSVENAAKEARPLKMPPLHLFRRYIMSRLERRLETEAYKELLDDIVHEEEDVAPPPISRRATRNS